MEMNDQPLDEMALMPGTEEPAISDGERDRIKIGILRRLIENAEKDREDFLNRGNEIKRYGYSDNYDFEYTEYLDDATFKAKVAKTAEAIQIMLPFLYQQNPHRQATPKPTASPEGMQSGQLLGEYLNATPKETNLVQHNKWALIDGLCYGRAVTWTGLDRRGLVCSKYIRVQDFYVDPSAEIPEQISWIARRRRTKRFELIKKYPDQKDAIKRLNSYEMDKNDVQKADSTGATYTKYDKTHDIIEYYEMYLRVGLHNFKGSEDDPRLWNDQGVEAGQVEVNDNPVKLCFVLQPGEHNGLILREGPWEVPYHLDDKWPATWCDLIDNPGHQWPVSPLHAGIGHQRALNWIYTLSLGKFRTTCRTLLGIAEINGQRLSENGIDKVLNGPDLDVITFKIDGQQLTMRDLVHQFQFDPMSGDFERMLNLISDQFEKSTSLHEILYAGETARQMRSAAEAEIKDERSRSRIEEMRSRVEAWASCQARLEAQCARWLLDGEDVGKVLGPEAGAAWGELLPPPEQQEEMLKQQFQQAGIDPRAAVQMIPELIKTQGVIYDQWIYEWDHDIEAGSTRRKNKEAQIDLAKELMNQGFASALNSGHPNGAMAASAMLVFYLETIDAPDHVLAAARSLMEPPPPPEPLPEEMPPEEMPPQ